MISEWKEYNTIEFSGKDLIPGFRIYLVEIKSQEERWFYIGMTGDNHYPSARSILHRLAGHIDLKTGSTQNQLMTALKKNILQEDGQINEEKLSKLHFKVHYWPIPGFEAWDGDMKNIDKECEKYTQYKAIQDEVAELELALIHEFKIQLNEKLLNKFQLQKSIEENYLSIFKDIQKIISS